MKILQNHILLATIICAIDAAKDQPCHYYMSSRIDQGVRYANGSILADGLVYEPHQQFTYDDPDEGVHVRGCTCAVKRCIRKCCYEHEVHDLGTCIDNPDRERHRFDPTIHTVEGVPTDEKASVVFSSLYGGPCKKEGVILDNYDENDRHILLSNGSVLMVNQSEILDQMSYCLEYFIDGNETFHSAIVCDFVQDTGSKTGKDWSFLLFSLGMIISLPFLLITLLVYGFVPELQNLHGKSLMGYTSGLLFAYAFLITAQIGGLQNEEASTDNCVLLAFGMYFFFMVAFFWLNVMCIDIWWTFRAMKAPTNRRPSEKRRFLLYSAYAWGMPTVLTSIVALMHFHPKIPDRHIKPGFGVIGCWFKDLHSQHMYFYVPVSFLVIVNIVLFAITAYTILAINRETAILRKENSRRHSQYEKNKQRFNIYLKLFLVMGINWVVDWISVVAGGSTYIWIFTDFCNSMQGIFIFVVFVCKDKIHKLVTKRYRTLRYGATMSGAQNSSKIRSDRSNTISL